MLLRFFIRLVLATVLALGYVNAISGTFTQEQACGRLIAVAQAQHLAIENSVGRYRCDPYAESKQYFVFQLHYAGGEPEGWGGSTLAGYYSVRKSDHAVLHWDFGNDMPGKIISRSPKK